MVGTRKRREAIVKANRKFMRKIIFIMILVEFILVAFSYFGLYINSIVIHELSSVLAIAGILAISVVSIGYVGGILSDWMNNRYGLFSSNIAGSKAVIEIILWVLLIYVIHIISKNGLSFLTVFLALFVPFLFILKNLLELEARKREMMRAEKFKYPKK